MGGYKKNSRRRQPRGPRSSHHHTVEHHQQPPPRPLEINEETRWKAKVFLQHQPQEGQATAADDVDDARLLLLLNKLSPTNFERHVTRFASTTTLHRSENRTRRAVDAVVSRAALDARYTAMYAALCVRLASELKPEAKAEEESTTAAETLPPSPSEKVDDGGAAAADSSVTSSPPSPSFGKVLVGHCRKELSVDPTLLLDDESDTNNHEDSGSGELEHPEERNARISFERKRYVGTARFVGELYNCRDGDGGAAAAVTGAIGFEELLGFVDVLFCEALPTTPGANAVVRELPLEGLCALLVTCGKKMEGEAAASDERNTTLWDGLERLVRGTEKDGQAPLSFRMKFMVADLLDLRSSGWVPSGHIAKHRKELVAKTLQEIHEEWGEGCGGPCQPQRRRGKKKSGKKVRFGRS